MGIFSKTEVPIGTASFAEKMSNIKKAFKEAHCMVRWSSRFSLSCPIDEINVTKKEAEEFMANISKLI